MSEGGRAARHRPRSRFGLRRAVRPEKVHVYAAGDAPLAELPFTGDSAVVVESFFADGEIGKPKEI